MCTYLRWPILYIFLLLVTYSIHEEYFDGITLHELVFPQVNSMTYFAHLLFLGKFFLHILWFHMHVTLVTYSVHMCPLGDLFCTLGSFDSLFWPHTSSFWSKFYVPLLHVLVCTLGNFTTYFVYLFLRGELIFTFYGYMCTYFWWPIVYTYLLLVNQSVRMELFDGLFFIHTSQSWPKSYKYPPFHDLVCRIWGLILYTNLPLFDLFYTSTTSSWSTW